MLTYHLISGGYNLYIMDISSYITYIPPVKIDSTMHEVLDLFDTNPDHTFLPVVDEKNIPLGIIRSYDLRKYAFCMFGAELVRRKELSEFLKPCSSISHTIRREELMAFAGKNKNSDGLIVTENGIYKGSILTISLLSIFEEHQIRTQQRLAQSQKMEALGTLAGGIAHDFNNILTPIFGYAELAKLSVAAGHPVNKLYLDQIMQCAVRAKELVSQILTFSRQHDSEKTSLRLTPIIKEVLKMIRATIPSTIDIESDIATESDSVVADPIEIHQILMNLCTNAYHAMKEKGGKLKVILCSHRGFMLGWGLSQELPEGDLVRISIIDTGHGITPAVLPRIFEPFYTTKQQGEGTGMGLSVVHGIVSKCKGAISVESTPGEGTIFHIYLPLHTAPVEDASEIPSTKDMSDNKYRVLFIDDETMITDLAMELFPVLNIDVEVENDSSRALVKFLENPSGFDAVVTDQTMPDMTGFELSKNILKIRPEIPVILCTGYSEVISAEAAKMIGIRDYILKPVNFHQLAVLIHRLCSSK